VIKTGRDKAREGVDLKVESNERIQEDMVEVLCRKIAGQIRLTGIKINVILGITRGGVIPATLIAYFLDVYDVRTISVVSYEGKAHREIEIVSEPNWFLFKGNTVLIVEDFITTGRTLAEVMGASRPLRNTAQKHARYLTASLFARETVPKPDFYSRVVPVGHKLWFPWTFISTGVKADLYDDLS
jgi:uncharacterized protein